MMRGSLPILLDTDPGIDDAIALFSLLGMPHVDLVGVTTVFGNATVEQTTTNAAALLALAGRPDVQVFPGADRNLKGSQPLGAAQVHGVDGLGDVGFGIPRVFGCDLAPQSAVDALIRLSHEYIGTLRIVAIGPLTNLALALRQDPTVAQRVHSVTIMGGAALVPGNVTAAAEANFYADAEAAAEVLAAPWRTVLAPLDLTLKHGYSRRQCEELQESAQPSAQSISRMMPVYFRFYKEQTGADGIFLHDALAALLAAETILPERSRTVPTVVDTQGGPAHGAVIADLRQSQKDLDPLTPHVTTIVFDVPGEVSGFVQELLLAGPQSPVANDSPSLTTQGKKNG